MTRFSWKLGALVGILALCLVAAGLLAPYLRAAPLATGGIAYKLVLNGNTYEVYMRPDTTPSGPNLTLTSQVTIKVPHGTGSDRFVVANLQNVVAGTQWTTASRIDAPTEAPTFDYISLGVDFPTNQRGAFGWTAGQEVKVFTFQNTGACLGPIALFENAMDPFRDPNSASTNPGNQITVLGLGEDSSNAYIGNYDSTPVSANCAAPGTATATSTSLPSTATATSTNTSVAPTATATATKTNTAVPPAATATQTNTPVAPTPTPQPTTTTGVEFAISFSDGTYALYMRPNGNPNPPNLTLTSQVTIKVPHGIGANRFLVSNLTSSVPTTQWALTSRIDAPIEDPTADYLSFNVSFTGGDHGVYQWSAGQEVKVFTFVNSGGCVGIVRLLENNTDPFNQLPNSVGTNPGNQIDILEVNRNNAYIGNYGSAQADCSSGDINNDKIGGIVWNDQNGDGVRQVNEVGLHNATVLLYPAGTAVRKVKVSNTALLTMTTDSLGGFQTPGLTPGRYYLEFLAPSDLVPTKALQGNDTTIDSDGLRAGLALLSRTSVIETGAANALFLRDAGFVAPASIELIVFNDRDRDGVREDGENPVPGTTIVIYDAAGNEVTRVVGDADGLFTIDGLTPAQYDITVTPPEGFEMLITNPIVLLSLDAGGSLSKEVGIAQKTTSVPTDPKAIDLVSFLAIPQKGSILLRWETAVEENTQGFHVYLGSSASFATSTRLTSNLVLSQGSRGGVYELEMPYDPIYDPSLNALHFWLLETELDSKEHQYGPFGVLVPAALLADRNPIKRYVDSAQ